MNLERSTRLAVAFARETARAPTARLCSVCVDVLNVSGAGITIMSGDQAGPICVSDPNIAALEDVQYTIGQGPCRDAYTSGRPVSAPSFDRAAQARWPAFVELARTSGIGAVFAYPLLAATSQIGVLALYQAREGDLTNAQVEDCVALSEILTETVLSLQDHASGSGLANGLNEAVDYRAEIYQASGMVAIQLSVAASEALARIRAHAFANDRTVADVAADVVARRLRLSDDRQTSERHE